MRGGWRGFWSQPGGAGRAGFGKAVRKPGVRKAEAVQFSIELGCFSILFSEQILGDPEQEVNGRNTGKNETKLFD